MINQDKWINTLPNINEKLSETTNQLDHGRWIDTIHKKNKYNSVKKYSLIITLFVCGLLFVSAVKNATRNLQKEINNLEVSINAIKFNLDQAILDHEVITSPENVSLLAEKYLNTNLVSYKRSQIKQLNNANKEYTKISKIIKEEGDKKKKKKFSDNIKTQVAKKIEKKRQK